MKGRNAINKTVRNFLSVCVLCLCAGSVALAQAGRGSISGLVSDPTGAVVNGAQVTALSNATGVALHTVTSAAGLYSFVSLTPGVYVVTASQKGFESVAQNNVQVTVDQVTTANIALRVGNVTETVEVTETSALVDTTNSTVGQLIDSAAIDRVPLLTRNVFDLVQLSAGVTPANGAPNSSSSQPIVNISSGRPGIDVSSYTINGSLQGSVYFMLDGSPLGVAENNVAAILPAMEIPEDGVEEFRVETQNTPASYQSGGAGVISLASKSGGDKFHGDAFAVFRPDILAANEFFNKQGQLLAGQPNQAPAFHRYQQGGAIGGPIVRRKLFFFADYEHTDEKLFDPSSIFTVPTTAERNGDFSADLPSASNPNGFTIYNPLAPDNLDGTRQGFPTPNVMTSYPGLTLNPTAVAFLSHYPKCNYPNPATCDTVVDPNNPLHLNNFQAPGLDPITAHRFDIRVDYYKSEKQRLFSRFSYARSTVAGVNAFNNEWDPNYAQNVTNARNFIIGDDYTINPTTVLQLRYSFTRQYTNQGGDPRQTGFDITTLGFPSSLAAAEAYKSIPIVFFNDYVANGLTSGVGGAANYNIFIFASMNHDFSATLTKVLGKHELSFGGEYMKRLLNVGQPPAPSGWYYFDLSATDQQTSPPPNQPTVGGSDFASFLLGMGNSSIESTNFTQDLFAAEASPYYAAFFQDTYHVRPNLTITAGLRWDIFGGKTERHNRLEYFDPTAVGTDPSSGLPFTGGEVFASSGHRSPFTTNLTNFAPRLGFSWQPEKHLVVRGGAGFYFGPSAQQVSSATLNSDGYSTNLNWSATCPQADGNTTINNANYVATGDPLTCVPGGAAGITGPYSLSNPFPSGLVPPSQLQPSGLETGLGASLNTMLHSQRTQETYNFNFGLEYEFPHEIVLSVGYVGSRGLFLPMEVADLNQLTLSQINALGTAGATQAQFVAAEPFPQFTSGGNISITGQGFGVMVHGYPGGDSDYSSLQTKVQKRMTKHFTTLASFTWAKLMSDDSRNPLDFVGQHGGYAQDWRNLSYEHSVSPQDVKYQFTWQASYDLPVGKNRAVNLNGVSNAILGDWTANGIFYLSSGIPIPSPVVGSSNSYLYQRANMTCDPSKGAPHTITQWFTGDCFAVPASQFVPGTAPAYLDHVRTMGANNLDLTLSKNVKLGETRNLRFDISSYNVANRPQFASPNVPGADTGWTAAAGFGQITATVNSPRQFQFGARFTF